MSAAEQQLRLRDPRAVQCGEYCAARAADPARAGLPASGQAVRAVQAHRAARLDKQLETAPAINGSTFSESRLNYFNAFLLPFRTILQVTTAAICTGIKKGLRAITQLIQTHRYRVVGSADPLYNTCT